MMSVSNGRECKMDHLMGELPVSDKVGTGAAVANRDSDRWTVPSLGKPRAHPVAIEKPDVNANLVNRKFLVVNTNCMGGLCYPFHDQFAQRRVRCRVKRHLNSALANLD